MRIGVLSLFLSLSVATSVYAGFCRDSVKTEFKGESKAKIPFSQIDSVGRDPVGTPWTNHVKESTHDVQGFVTTQTKPGLLRKQEMYYRIDFPKLPNGREWKVLQHGLGDHSGQINALASLYLKEGYTVIRTDLLGHGRSLYKNRKAGVSLDEPTTIAEQAAGVAAVLDIARTFGMKRVHLIGHSLGGAVMLKTAAHYNTKNKPSSDFEISSISLIGFYAQDLGDWIGAETLLGRQVTQPWAEAMKFMSPAAVRKNFEDSFESSYYLFHQYFSYLQAGFGYSGLSKINDSITWPHLEKFMYKSYEPYFKYYAEKVGIDVNDSSVKIWIDEQIRSAVAVTRGAKSFNLFHMTEDLPAYKIPMQVIAATKDELVPVAMMKQAAMRLEDLGFSVELTEISDAGHLMTRTHPKKIFEILESSKGATQLQ